MALYNSGMVDPNIDGSNAAYNYAKMFPNTSASEAVPTDYDLKVISNEIFFYFYQ